MGVSYLTKNWGEELFPMMNVDVPRSEFMDVRNGSVKPNKESSFSCSIYERTRKTEYRLGRSFSHGGGGGGGGGGGSGGSGKGRMIFSSFSLESLLLLIGLTASLLILPLILPPLPPPPLMLLMLPICILAVLMILAFMPTNARRQVAHSYIS